MFSRLSAAIVYAVLAFTVLAAAMPGNIPTKPPTTTTVTKPITTTVPVTTTVTFTSPPATTTVPASQCNTGSLQCCNSVQSASSGPVGLLLGLLGIVLQDLTVLVGITCSPISAIGIGGNSCSAQPVCCENNSFNGIIAIGCTPINLNL